MASLFSGVSNLLSKKGNVPCASALGSKEFVLIYFSAHWCPPCRRFTPALVEFYHKYHANNPTAAEKMEIVFVSSDKSQAEFDEYYHEMPWLALPFEQRSAKEKLSKKFKVQGIPSLILVDNQGHLVNDSADEAVREGVDAAVESFPWKPKTLAEILQGAELRDKAGAVVPAQELANRYDVIAFYFSAHWCPPCRGFTPQLIQTYQTIKARANPPKMEFFFVSSDRDEKAYSEYYHEMPWGTLRFGSGAKEELSQLFKVEGIPTLVTVDAKTLATITTKARGVVPEDPQGEKFPWVAEPLPLCTSLGMTEDKVDALNERVCYLLVNGSDDEAARTAFCGASATVDAQRGGCELLVSFFTVGADAADLFERIRAVTGLKVPEGKPSVVALRLGPGKTTSVYEGDVTSQSGVAEFALEFYKRVADTEAN